MSMEVEFHYSLTSDQEAEWTRFWETCQHSHPRQHVIFAQVERAKGCTPVFVMARDGQALGLVGLFSLRPCRWLGGASLEATCHRGPLFNEPAHLRGTLSSVVEHLRALRVGRILLSMRWAYPEAGALESALTGSGFAPLRRDGAGSGTIPLDKSDAELLASFSQSTRAQIRLAQRRGVVVRAAHTVADAQLFLRCFMTMQEQRGLLPIPAREFPATFEHVLRHHKLGVLATAHYGHNFLGGMSVLRDTMIAYPSRYAIGKELPPEVATVRIGPLLWWEAIRWARSHGCRYLDVEGFTPNPDPHSHLYHIHAFKAGFRPTPITLLAGYTRVGNQLVNTIRQVSAKLTDGLRLARATPYQIQKRLVARLRTRHS